MEPFLFQDGLLALPAGDEVADGLFEVLQETFGGFGALEGRAQRGGDVGSWVVRGGRFGCWGLGARDVPEGREEVGHRAVGVRGVWEEVGGEGRDGVRVGEQVVCLERGVLEVVGSLR